ncbi:hypothetical protein PCASD_12457 [Puccinia coronata f. sp. avenae]|uniref:PAS domain-containing protein n=1 Tax=Puccinia coronata f. sp. avenae TaxID=200324 RepID=A0A2N5U0A5_9BASI|nr:hypothetical protein PCASD_12457 [Puccinia coronata f. sp. avenae]
MVSSEGSSYLAIGPAAMPTTGMTPGAIESSKQHDQSSMSPFSLLNASTSTSGQQALHPLASASAGYHTNPSSLSVGTPNEYSSSSASSHKNYHQIPTAGLPTSWSFDRRLCNSSINVIGTPHPLVDGETQAISTPQTTARVGGNEAAGAQGAKRLDSFALPPPATHVVALSFEKRGGGGKTTNNRESNLKKVLSLTQPAPPSDLSLVKADSFSSFSHVRHPQSAGLIKPSPGPKDLTKSIKLACTETILAKVSLENAVILYFSPGWTTVTGLDPQSVIGTPLGEPIDGNYELFNEAHQRLMDDVGNTVELQFTIKISLATGDQEGDSNLSITTRDHFLPMMVDRITGEGVHSMWVIRLISLKAVAVPTGTAMESKGSHHTQSHGDLIAQFPAAASLSTELLLCRICEHYLPAYYFERHNETCAETHRLEMQVSKCKKRLSDLKRYHQRVEKRGGKKWESQRALLR